LRNVIKGRQDLSPTTVEKFLKELGLTVFRASIFRAMVTHDQAVEELIRREGAILPRDQVRLEAARRCYAEARDRLQALMTFTSCQGLDEGEIEWLTKWFYVVIRETTICRGFQDDPDWIAAALRPQIDREHVAEALAFLSTLTPTQQEICVDEVMQTASLDWEDGISSYYGVMNRRLLEAMQTLHMDGDTQSSSFLRGLTLALPESCIPQVRQSIVMFLLDLITLREVTLGEADQVYQVNLQFFPLTCFPSSDEP